MPVSPSIACSARAAWAVYSAAHPRLPRKVALKVLHADLTRDDYVRTRFEAEAEHSARLDHPNIVTVYDCGREGDELWIAMQFIEVVMLERY